MVPERAELDAEADAANDLQRLTLAQVVHVVHRRRPRCLQQPHELMHNGNNPGKTDPAPDKICILCPAKEPEEVAMEGHLKSPHVLLGEGWCNALSHKAPLRGLAALRQEVGQPGPVADLQSTYHSLDFGAAPLVCNFKPNGAQPIPR